MSKIIDIIDDIARIDSIDSTANAATSNITNVDNTADLDKPISTATQSALDLKANQATTYTKTEVDVSIGLLAPKANPTFTGIVSFAKGADIASATALTLGTDGNYFDVTGITTITSISTTGAVGTVIKLHFDGILTLTHNATSLVLPSGANIVTAVGDEVEFIEYSVGNFRCVNYTKADGTSVVSSGSSIPLGVVVPIASNLVGTHAIPLAGVVDSSGWMYCDGSIIPDGNIVSGSVPNLTDGRFIRGFASSGTTGGSDSFTLTEANLPAHTHSTPNHSHTGSTNTTGEHAHTTTTGGAPGTSDYAVSPSPQNVDTVPTSLAGNHSHTLTIDSGGGGISGSTGSTTAVSHIPKYINMKFIIKVN